MPESECGASTATGAEFTILRSSIEGSYTSFTPASSVTPGELVSEADDIAIIGLSCRVPGGNDSASQLWDFLLDKGDASGSMPEMRWQPYNTRQPGNPGILSKTTSTGYFLKNLNDFDASFFGISPREAEQMDPQQRIAVEVAWEALEHAGIPPQSLAGSDTAVFMGVNSNDYSRLLLEDLPNIEAWMGVGTAFCGIPNRISYLLDLMGPSSAIDAACASSLVAIHHGRQALLTRETSLVIAGGVNALIGPGLTRVLDEAGAISEDGRCRSFDDSASGYGRGEGAGIVILKRMADAMEDEDNILAVLKGSAVGADGRTNGIMAPNQKAQELVAKKALKEAGILAETISYVEAHATSTPLGDRTECAAMANVYGSGARLPGSEHCLIGSIKSNIGHLEAGAGVMGFIKATMAIRNGLVPPQANLTTLSTKINWEESLLKVVTEPTPWPKSSPLRRAAVASFGYGGTVSHAIIEAAPPQVSSSRRISSRPSAIEGPTVLLLSAPQPARTKVSAANIASWLEDPDCQRHQNDLDSLAYTFAVKRGHHKFRTAIIAENQSEAVKLLKAVSQGENVPQVCSGRAYSKEGNKGTVWVFSGHGAHWKEMGQVLIDKDPAFVEAVDQVEPIIQKEMGFSVTAALRSGDFESTDKIQVLTFVMQIGLSAILNAASAKPSACIGHSMGELAASVIAGALTLSEATLICCVRARLYRTVMGAGAMVLVNMAANEVAFEVDRLNDITIAIISSPSSCVVSGTVEAVQEFSSEMEKKRVKVRAVKTDVAFHSPLLLPLAAPLRQLLSGALKPRTPDVPLYSTSLSDPRGEDLKDIDYWVNNMVKPVLLTSAINAATEDGYKLFLEVSSHPIVAHSINETLMDTNSSDSIVIPTLLRDKDTQKGILLALGKLHCAGESIDFRRFLPGNWSHDVPRTQWEHQPYWRKVSDPSAGRKFTHDVDAHVLLGARTQINGTDGVLWQTYLEPHVKPFPGRHPLHGAEIVPASVLMNTFLSAAPGQSLCNVSLRVPVVVDPPREIQVFYEKSHMRLSSRLAASTETCNSRDDHSWQVNTTTEISPAKDLRTLQSVDIGKIRQHSKTLCNSFSIEYLGKVGVTDMGFPWKVLEHFETNDDMLAKVDAFPDADPSKPWAGSSWASILDAATSVSSTIFYKEPLLRMPTAIDSVTMLENVTAPRVSYVYVQKTATELATDVSILDEEGRVLVEIRGLKFAGIEGSPVTRISDAGLVHRIAWPPALLSETPLHFLKVTFISSNECSLLEGYRNHLSSLDIEHETVNKPESIYDLSKASVVIFIADGAKRAEHVYPTSAENSDMLLRAVKVLTKLSSQSKLFCITQNTSMATGAFALSQASLIGLARIIQSEEPEVFGGLIDVEDNIFPMQAIKYVQGVDVIRIEDSVARNARLRPFTADSLKSRTDGNFFQIRPQGTYLITGGLGALGLEIAFWLAEKGARRLVLVSRRRLPPRRHWPAQKENVEIQRILALEAMGVSVHTLAVDMSTADASSELQLALDAISLPPVTGVIHAAGTIANQTVQNTTPDAFNHVISPKIAGAMALHESFPPNTLDFMVFFSSCGQLVGFTGQASYASGNAFLDILATHRRNLGDNSVSMLWTNWRGLGMAASSKYVDVELHALGVTDITKDEAFRAWELIFKYDTEHAVILRTLPLPDGDPAPHPILTDCLIRQPKSGATDPSTTQGLAQQEENEPTGGPELEEFLCRKITKCVASTLSLAEDSIDPHFALSELGMDSVMTVALRGELQKVMGTKVGPTLVWNCPTVHHLIRHFAEKKSSK